MNLTKRDFGYAASAAFALALGVYGANAIAQGSAPDYAKIIAQPDRSDADRTADKRRDPMPFLNFAGLKPGMKVLDMGAGGGYSTELVARVVAPNGTAYGQNPPDQFERARQALDGRTKTPGGKNIVALVRPYDDPVPADVRDLDMITFLFFYHDTTYLDVDRAKMNSKLFAALKPGATMVIADHSAKAGEGATVGKTLHRIDEALLRKEVEGAGFKFVAEGNFWKHPDDTRDYSTNRPPHPVDEFALKFEKPR
jgi:predicted methyltransferase